MGASGANSDLRRLLDEQLRYYRALAPTYVERAIRSADGARLERELAAAIDAHCQGDVLELACGPGSWTGMLAARARTVTAVDGAPEMLELAAAAVSADHVRFEQADIFAWRPPRRYDAVFFGFWLSHVPDERWDGFWALVRGCLAPGGRVVFVDDGYRTGDELVYGADSSIVERRLGDGSRHRIVKVKRTAAGVQHRLAADGWSVEVRPVGIFFWGSGRAQASPS